MLVAYMMFQILRDRNKSNYKDVRMGFMALSAMSGVMGVIALVLAGLVHVSYWLAAVLIAFSLFGFVMQDVTRSVIDEAFEGLVEKIFFKCYPSGRLDWEKFINDEMNADDQRIAVGVELIFWSNRYRFTGKGLDALRGRTKQVNTTAHAASKT